MVKSVLATVGIVAIVGGIAVWQIGFFSEKASDVSKQVERATASARVDKAIAKMRDDIASLDGKARKYAAESRKLELSLEREQKEIDQLNEAIKKLSSAAKEAGLPKPSEVTALTEEQGATKLTFGGKSVTGREVYATLERWYDDCQKKSETAQIKRDTVERMRATAEQIKIKKSEMTTELAKLENSVKELEASKDLAKLNAELAEMEASVRGVDAGEIGRAHV